MSSLICLLTSIGISEVCFNLRSFFASAIRIVLLVYLALLASVTVIAPPIMTVFSNSWYSLVIPDGIRLFFLYHFLTNPTPELVRMRKRPFLIPALLEILVGDRLTEPNPTRYPLRRFLEMVNPSHNHRPSLVSYLKFRCSLVRVISSSPDSSRDYRILLRRQR